MPESKTNHRGLGAEFSDKSDSYEDNVVEIVDHMCFNCEIFPKQT